jgi:hypothetical protein
VKAHHNVSNHGSVETINAEYLKGDDINRFEKIRLVIENEYSKVLSSINEPARVPYIPTVYVIPWIVTREIAHMRRFYYSQMSFDPKDFERWAIFSSLNFLERFQDHIAGGLGHEIAHFLQTKGKVKISRKMLIQQMEDPYYAEARKEREAEEAYGFFKEPVKSMIRKWTMLSRYREIKDEVIFGAEIIDSDRFRKLILRNRRKQFDQFIKTKIKEIQDQDKTKLLSA